MRARPDRKLTFRFHSHEGQRPGRFKRSDVSEQHHFHQRRSSEPEERGTSRILQAIFFLTASISSAAINRAAGRLCVRVSYCLMFHSLIHFQIMLGVPLSSYHRNIGWSSKRSSKEP
ncbi:hypothetical protein CC2G_011969 [Coprinopsis cinerea AmutBmut pab1-1]|nr:hypothetical protein CC2G_011969 [Coprinopsis cinerea AmutBmut pab1-1]